MRYISMWSPTAFVCLFQTYANGGNKRYYILRYLHAAVVSWSAMIISIGPANAQPIENAETFDITVNGYIAEHCAIGSIADMDFGNLERRGLNRKTNVDLDCNIPFNMTITGSQGALTHTRLPNGQGDFSGRVPYALSIEMPIRHPAAQIINTTFNSNQLRSGGVISSNGGIAIDGFVLGVELGRANGRAGLLAGEYAETITITISPI